MRFRAILRRCNTRIKTLVYGLRPGLFLGWLQPLLFHAANTLAVSKWMSRQDKKFITNDFFTFGFNHAKREKLYEAVAQQVSLADEPVVYLEFGVSGGHSFRWWASHLQHPQTRLWGFDTFSGLPEKWGTFRKGDMAENIPQMDDNRTGFIKGLFQKTLPTFIKEHPFDKTRKIIHMDADLFSSTLFVLTSLAPYLSSGDIIFFDEFNVPNHEFLAFKHFTESYYVKTKLLGAVNNYYQVAFMIL